MLIGVGSYAYRWAIGAEGFRPAVPLTAAGLLEKAAAAGAEVVQICDNVSLENLSQAERAALAACAGRPGLVLEVGIKGSQFEHLRRHIEIAAALGARLLRVVLDEGNGQPSLGQCKEIIASILPALHDADVTLAVENHFSHGPREIARLIDAISDARVGICLDPLNSVSLPVGPNETIEALASQAVSVYVKDVALRRVGPGFQIIGCPIGEGVLDVASLLTAVKKSGRDPNIVVESWMDRLEDEHATLAREEAWVRQGISCLRSMI